MDTFRRRLGLTLVFVSLMTMLAACEDNTVPVITKFRVTPECLDISEHRVAMVDEHGNLVLDDNGNPIFIDEGTFAEIQFFGRASGGNAQSDPTGGNTPLTWEWTFGDGTSVTNVVTGFHKYYDAGQYKVTLTVKDKDGETASDEMTIVVGAVGTELDILSVDVTSSRKGQYQSNRDATGLTSCQFRAWLYDVHGVLDTPCVINGLTEQYEWRWMHGGQEILHESDLQQAYLYPGPHSDRYDLTVTELSTETVRSDSLVLEIPADELQLPSLLGATIVAEPVPKFADNAGTCEFVGWDIQLSGKASTECGTIERATQYQWNWEFSDGSTASGSAQAVRSYAFNPQNPGQSTDTATLHITEALRNPQGATQDVTQDDTMEFTVPAGPVPTIRNLQMALVDQDPDPRRTVYANPIWDLVSDGQGGSTCEFVGWDVLYDVTLLTGCDLFHEPSSQYEWAYDYGDGTQGTDPVGVQRHRYLYDPSTPGSHPITTHLTLTDRSTGDTKGVMVTVTIPEHPTSVPDPCPDNAKH